METVLTSYQRIDGQQHTWTLGGATFHARWNRVLWQWAVVVQHKGQRALGNGSAKVATASIRHIGDEVFECKTW